MFYFHVYNGIVKDYMNIISALFLMQNIVYLDYWEMRKWRQDGQEGGLTPKGYGGQVNVH